MSYIVGNDISSWQGDPDFDTLKQNANFLIVKATESNNYISPNLTRDQSEARRVGLLLGYYHFARPSNGNNPEAEAAHFLDAIGQLQEGEMLVLDYEDTWSGNVVWWCKAFLDYIFEKTGIKPLIYLNDSLRKSYNWQSIVDAGYGLWLAWYNETDPDVTPWPFMAMRQWTNKETVPGISGSVDGDYFYGTPEQFKAYGYHAPLTPPSPIPPLTPSNSVSESPSSSSSSSVSPSSSQSPSQSPSASPSPSDAPSIPAALLPELAAVINDEWYFIDVFGGKSWWQQLAKLRKILND